MMKHTILAVLTCGALGAHLDAQAAGYAEGIYADYASASGHVIDFRIETREKGALAELAGRPLSDFLGVPSYVLQTDNVALKLENLALAPADLKSLHLGDLQSKVDGFDDVGFPVASGSYRLLQVHFSDDDKTPYQHAALEICFASHGHCVVYDPSIEFLDSEVNAVRGAKAAGWAITEHSEPSTLDLTDPNANLKAGRCGLASNPATISRSWSQARYTYTWKNVYGITMVSKTVGAAQWGMRCDSSCRPQPFGYANASSAWANIPFSVACGYNTNSGTSGSSGKFVAKTGCAHRTVLGAKFSATKSGTGLSVDVSINATGSVTQHGGSTQDRCAYF